MSKAEAELQRQVNDYQAKNHALGERVATLETENEVLRKNVADLQEQLRECQRSKLK